MYYVSHIQQFRNILISDEIAGLKAKVTNHYRQFFQLLLEIYSSSKQEKSEHVTTPSSLDCSNPVTY